MRTGGSLAGLAVALAMACRFTEPALTEQTPTLTPPPELRDCPIPPGQPRLPETKAGEILDYLNGGGSPATLRVHLENMGQLPQSFATLDLDGNWLNDLVIATVGQRSGIFQVYLCADDEYQLAYISTPSEPPGSVTIHSTEDLTDDGLTDLLVSRLECGAHTCTARVELLVWLDARLQNRLRGDTSDLPSPEFEVVRSERGPAEIQMTATGIGSAGAGPYRLRTRIWQWDPAQAAFIAGEDQIHSSNFRIHRLHDADDASAAGNYGAALAFYQQVIDDPALDDWVSEESGRAALAAYAQFRRMTTILQLGDHQSAEQAYQALLATNPAGTAGHGFARMGELFWVALSGALEGEGPPSPEALEAACQAASAYAITHSADTLDRLYFGYANRTYGHESVCPLGP